MALAADVITLGVPEVQTAHGFYTSALYTSAAADDHSEGATPEMARALDMHGVGQIALRETAALAAGAGVEPATSGFRGYVLSYIVDQPSEVTMLLDAAVQGGATVLKPAKKGFFGGFSAVYQAPDGAIWKLAASTRKDTGPARTPPKPTELGALLGVADPRASKLFYEALGMTVDRDYGKKYVDFHVVPGASRFGLMPRKDLAKDAGAREDGSGFCALVLNHRAESREEVDHLLTAAVAAGGQAAVPAGESEPGVYAGHFADPDGFLWKVEAGAR